MLSCGDEPAHRSKHNAKEGVGILYIPEILKLKPEAYLCEREL